MPKILNLLMLFVVSFTLLPREIFSNPERMANFEQIRKNREALQKKFEENENEILADEVENDEDERPQVQKNKTPQNIEQKAGVRTPPIAAAPPPPAVQNPVEGSPSFLTRYLTRLHNAYGCFRDFMAALYRARFARDNQIVNCIQTGGSNCEQPNHSSFESAAHTLGAEFKVCIDRPTGTPSLHTANSGD